MAEEKQYHPISIIRHRGTPNKAQLPDGTWVERQEKIFIMSYGAFIPCAPYSEHFIYETPNDPVKYPGSSFRCSCGSAVIVVGPSGYVLDASPQGKMLVCMVHATTGHHATGNAKWI